MIISNIYGKQVSKILLSVDIGNYHHFAFRRYWKLSTESKKNFHMVIVCITIILVIVSHKTEENNCNSYNSHGKTKIIVILTIPMGKHMIIVMFTIPMEKTKIIMILSISMDHNHSVSQFVNHIGTYVCIHI